MEALRSIANGSCSGARSYAETVFDYEMAATDALAALDKAKGE